MINTVPSTTTFTITSSAAATATVSAGGSTTVEFYFVVGPQKQTYGYGWGVSTWGGTISDAASTTVNEDLDNSETTITLSSAASFPTAGTILIGSELITYTGKSTNDLTGCTRGALGTTATTHSNGATVVNATDYNAWGDAVKAALVVKGVVDEGFHVKVLLLATVATNTSPKLSKDQRPGSKFT